jgi:hypothetical protein
MASAMPLTISKNERKCFPFFRKIEEKRRVADEIDWIMKYFILISLADFSLLNLFVRTQNARVFISSMIQIDIQEFINKHMILEIRIIRLMIGMVLILILFKLQI